MATEVEHHIGRAVMASHPDWPKLNELNQMLCIATNPQMFFNGFVRVDGRFQEEEWIPFEETQVFSSIAEPERLAIIDTVRNKLQSKLRVGRFADFIDSVNFPLAPEDKK